MKTIHKFQFLVSDFLGIAMPEGSEILHINLQRASPCLWALVDTAKPMVQRTFRVFGTGHEIPPEMFGCDFRMNPKMKYLATFQQPPFVWHMFEVFE